MIALSAAGQSKGADAFAVLLFVVVVCVGVRYFSSLVPMQASTRFEQHARYVIGIGRRPPVCGASIGVGVDPRVPSVAPTVQCIEYTVAGSRLIFEGPRLTQMR